MPLPSCKALRQLGGGTFFSAKYDDGSTGPCHPTPLITYPQAKACESSGCAFCTILMAKTSTFIVPQEALQTNVMMLRRARYQPEQAFSIAIEPHEIARITFSRIPPDWRQLSLAELGQPWDDLALMRTWLSNCLTKHSKCRSPSNQGLPKRLLDVRAFPESEDVRLVERENVPSNAQYVTLSHCWGPSDKHPIRTTKATFSERTQRIQYDNLSTTFKDAVTICRELGQRYIWIDSLCIIQDDTEDWSHEAASMAPIYGGSLVTLAALSSADSTQGCRTRPTESSRARYQDFNFGSKRVRIWDGAPAYWHSEYGDDPFRSEGYGANPLRTRAWTLQERELSLRCINFAPGQLLWQCRTMKGSSELPWRERAGQYGITPIPMKLNPDEDFNPLGAAFQRDRWYGLVEDYSSRNIANESDKLPALAGLASRFSEEQSPGNYLAGIWSDHCPSALLWVTVLPQDCNRGRVNNSLFAFPPRRPQVYRAPSWSWAAIDGEISYESQRMMVLSDRRPPNDGNDFGNFEITGSYYQLVATFDPLGAPVDAALRMRGDMAELEVHDQPIEGRSTGSLRRLVTVDGTTVGAIYPDIVDEFLLLRSVYVLSVRSEPYASLITLPSNLYKKNDDLDGLERWKNYDLRMGLALLRARAGEVYRRVGLVRWLKGDVFEGMRPVQLRIV